MENKLNPIKLTQVYFDKNDNLLPKGDINDTIVALRPGNKELWPKILLKKLIQESLLTIMVILE